MRPLLLGAAALGLSAVFAASQTPQAQAGAHRFGIVDVARVTAAAPGGAAVVQAQQRAEADLRQRRTALASMEAAIARGSATAQQRQAYAAAQQAFARAEASHAQALQQAAAPVVPRVNAAVAAAARAQNFTVVFDRQVAGRSGLIIWANEGATDLTQAAITRVRQ